MIITLPIVAAVIGVWGGGNTYEAYRHTHPHEDAVPCVNFVDDPSFFQLQEDGNCDGQSPSQCSNLPSS